MPGIELASLSARQQQLAEKARQALALGQFEYALEATGEVLRSVPGCVAVRRLQREAQLAWSRRHGSIFRRARARVGLLLLWLRHPPAPADRLAAAEGLLALDPAQCGALKVFAAAALELKWPETAAFMREAVRQQCPGDRANAIALGEAWIGAGRPVEALTLAEEILREAPNDGPALELLRHASIAQTVAEGLWESPGTFRDKLKR